MTVCLGSLKAALAAKVRGLDGMELSMLGSPVELFVEGVGQSERAYAVKVRGSVGCFNKIPHVTLAVAPGHRPVDSNTITEWRDWPEKDRLQLNGTLQHVGGGFTIKNKPKPSKKSGAGAIPVGALVKKHLPDLQGKQIRDAIEDVAQWMSKMVISSQDKVEEYIQGKKKPSEGAPAEPESSSDATKS